MKITKIGKFNVHNLAGLVPMANSIEQLALQEDIRLNGLQQPIILFENKIIDGRCRAEACKNLNINPDTVKLPYETTQKEAAAKVFSLNIRRNLTKTQKAISAYYQWKADKSLQKKMLYTAWGVDKMLFAAAESLDSLQGKWLDLLFEGNKLPIGIHQKDSRGKLRQKESSSLIAVNKWAIVINHTLERVVDSQKDTIIKDFIDDLASEHPQIQDEYHKLIRTLHCNDSRVEQNQKVITVDEGKLNKCILLAAKRAFVV